MSLRPSSSLLAAAALAASLLGPVAGTPAAASPEGRRTPAVHPPHPSQVVLDWERTAMSTIYRPNRVPATSIPVGVLYLGFTSKAMWEAAERSTRAARSSEAAAVATAAHDVLVAYFPDSSSALDLQLAASLARVGDGPAETRGAAIGRAAAAELVAERADDGRGNTAVVYSKPALPGFWQPSPAPMLAPWLGSVDYLALDADLPVDGPDAMTGAEYATDYEEVRSYGRSGSSARSAFQTETAKFFNFNSAIQVSSGLLDSLEEEPIGLRRTTRLFATMHVAMADTIIRCWELKRDVGFWRPFQAIAGAADDGNPSTQPEPGWTPLIPNPPYSDYISGHGSLTSPAVEAIRMELGDDYDLTLPSVVDGVATTRTYTRLSDIEHEALHARIWGGLHFRDAMVDAYDLGHRTAHAVAHELE